jgi:amino acid adenylation domain-containing protein
MRILKPHEAIPLGRLISALSRSTSSRQLFDVTVSYLRYPENRFPLGIDKPSWNIAHVHSRDAIALHMHTYGDSSDVYGDICLNPAAFNSEISAEFFAKSLIQLVGQIHKNDDVDISAIPLLTTDQVELLRKYENGPEKSYSRDDTVISLFENQAMQFPSNVALQNHDGSQWSYAKLSERSSSIARTLEDRGVNPGDIVALAMERSPEMIASIFGILKSGAAYLPIDSEYPEDRVKYMLEDSHAKLVISNLTHIIDSDDSRYFDPYAVQFDASRYPVCNNALPQCAAYVIYTSGSTGRPKGVIVEHHAVINRLEWMQEICPLGGEDVLLQKTPISFDVSVWELFWWAMTGASVALLKQGAQRDPREIIRTISTQGVTVAHFVPSMLEPYVQALADDMKNLDAVASLRCLFTSGEALAPSLVNKYKRVFSTDKSLPRLINLYGPTEATVDVTYHEVGIEQNTDVEVVPIGVPINNTSTRIVSQHGVRVPIGISGELQIGGVQLAKGYLNRSELTSERFILDKRDANKRWYRTGDLAAWSKEGHILYLGRIDSQVKIRGNRIELGEVKSALITLPGILNAEVLVDEDTIRGKHLVGIYVAKKDVDERDIRAQLSRVLPVAMVPARFERLKSIPLTPNGKFDRMKAVRDLAIKKDALRPLELPETEAVIAKVWGEVLDQHDINPDDDFYSLGGDSILMLKVRSELEAHGWDVSLTDLAQHTTVRSLGCLLDKTNGNQQILKDLPAFALMSDSERGRLIDCEDAYPASQLQLGLIYHSRGNQESRTYKDVFRYTIKTTWDEKVFSLALEALVRRHPALRTTFNLSDFEKPLHIVKRHIPIENILLVVRPEPNMLEKEIDEYIKTWSRYNYSFVSGPLFHVGIFITKDSEVIDLLLSFHHAILDGGSVANLIRELLLSHSKKFDPSDLGYIEEELPNPSLFVSSEIKAMEDNEYREYWKNYLNGAPNTLPIALARYSDQPSEGLFSYRFQVDPHLDSTLQTLAKAFRLPVKSLYLAAHSIAIASMSGKTELVTGIVTHSRPDIKNSEYILGLFLNTIPLRVVVNGVTWLQLAETIYKNEKKNHRYRFLPLSAIQTHAESVVVQTAFNYIHFHILQDVSAKSGIEILDFHPREETNFSILVNVMRDVSDVQTSVRIDFDGNLYTKEQGEAFGRLFQRALQRIAYEPHRDATLNEPLATFGTIIPSVSENRCETIPDLIRRAVERNPKSAAITHNNKEWTYQELWETSSKIASLLHKNGVKKQDIIGIALPRSLEQVAAVIAIIRTGAVCLPIDTSYPSSRIQLILDIADPAMLITNSAVNELPPVERKITIENKLTSNAIKEVDVDISPEDLAYVLFTSGSTGRPKGVTMPHRSLFNLINWQNTTNSGYQITSTLQFAPLSFDVSFQEILSTLSSGSVLHLVDETQREDPSALLRLLDSKGVERVFLPYVALQQLAETAVTLGLYPRKLRIIASSGEQLRVTREIRSFVSRLKGGILENQYGPTETHVVAYHNMSDGAASFPSFPPIGVPIKGVGIFILDEHLNVVPDGAPGEICVFGKSLAAGYYRSLEQTRQRFIERPEVPGKVFYRTGDIGIRSSRGEIISLGRNDTQVKVRGYRIEPSEIELKILQFFESMENRPEVAVVARPRNDIDSYLVAFLVGQEDRDLQEQLHKYLVRELPTYMIPTHVVWVDSIPKTPSGKRDDAELRKVDIKIKSNKKHRAPNDQCEYRLCELTAELLHIPKISPEQSIFDCGATSLTAMRIVVLVEKLYSINIPLSAFVNAPTIEQLATLIRDSGGEFKFDPLVPLRETGSRTPLVLVHPMGGNILSYLRMLPHLPTEQPLYALQASGVDVGTSPITSVVEQATLYIEAIKRVQPMGPYLIGGWSYGGFTAFEIAKQLIRNGEKVANILILDTMALSSYAQGKASDDALITWFFWELLWTSKGTSSPVQIVPSNISDLQEKFDCITDHAIKIGAIPSGNEKAVIRRLFEVYRANWIAATEYNTGRPPLDITLIRAKKPLPTILREMHDAIRSEYQDPKNGWENKTSGNVKVIELDGDHLTMMEEPYVKNLVSAILQEINILQEAKNV